MKKSILFVVAITISFLANAQWTDNYYSSKSMDLSYGYGTKIITGSTAIIFGVSSNLEDGKIFKTINGGASFSQVVTAGNIFRDAYFIDANTGFVVGEDKNFKLQISKTSDGGVTWKTTSYTDYNGGTSIQFLNATTGFIATQSGILKTADGGTKWTSVYPSSVKVVEFPSPSIGYAIASSQSLYKTIDGGNTWTDISANFDYYYSIETMYFLNVNTGFILPKGGSAIYRTTDGGNTWKSLDITADPDNFYEIKFFNATQGYICGESNNGAVLYKTSDSGLTWTKDVERPSAFSFYGFDISGSFVITAGFGSYSKNSSFVSVGVQDDLLASASFSIYPNPSSSILHIGDNSVAAEFTNNLGELVLKSGPASILDVSSLADGVYQVAITDEKGKIERHKFLKN